STRMLPVEIITYILDLYIGADLPNLSLCFCCKLFRDIVYGLWKRRFPFLSFDRHDDVNKTPQWFAYIPKDDYVTLNMICNTMLKATYREYLSISTPNRSFLSLTLHTIYIYLLF